MAKLRSLLLLVLLLGSLFAPAVPARAGEQPGPPPEGAVCSASASGPDGSSISAEVLWGEMSDLPHNADGTFYPGDELRVRVRVRCSERYDRVEIDSTVERKTFGVRGDFDGKLDLRVREDAPPGLRGVRFTILPKRAKIVIHTRAKTGYPDGPAVEEMGGEKLVDGQTAGTRSVEEVEVEQGRHVVSFGAVRSPWPSDRTYRIPPPVEVWAAAGGTYHVEAVYVDNGLGEEPWSACADSEDPSAFEPVPPVTAELRIRVVPYNPRFVAFPYLCLGGVQSSYRAPCAVLLRYDGNRYDPENGSRLSLDQRAVLDGVSVSGAASWPLRADGRQQRHRDNGDPDFCENGDPVMYEDGEVVRSDSGVPRYEVADISTYVVRAPCPELTVLYLSASFRELENVWENVRGADPPRGGRLRPPHEASRGIDGLRLRGMTFAFSTREVGGEEVHELFPSGSGSPLVFDREHRYLKLVFDLRDDAAEWIADGGGALSLDLSFWWASRGWRTLGTGIGWSPIGLHQPVRVTAWRLRPWARENLENNPRVVYLDEAWAADNGVSFDVRFIPVFDAENFLTAARGLAEVSLPAAEQLGGLENAGEALENALRILPPELRGLPPNLGLTGAPAGDALYSLANLDNLMIRTIIQDTGMENGEPQSVSGSGEAQAEIARRGVNLFAVEERAWPEGENGESARVRWEVVSLPFDEERPFAVDVNLSGEGMVAEVASDTPARLELRLHAPPRSGGLRSVRILDNRGNLLFRQDFPPSSLAQLSLLGPLLGAPGGTAQEPVVLSFQKTPSTPTELYVELTNEWGASRTQRLLVTPWAPAEGVGATYWGLLLAAGLFAAAWVAFVNWLRARRLASFAGFPA
jgi:hypothetical protein